MQKSLRQNWAGWLIMQHNTTKYLVIIILQVFIISILNTDLSYSLAPRSGFIGLSGIADLAGVNTQPKPTAILGADSEESEADTDSNTDSNTDFNSSKLLIGLGVFISISGGAVLGLAFGFGWFGVVLAIEYCFLIGGITASLFSFIFGTIYSVINENEKTKKDLLIKINQLQIDFDNELTEIKLAQQKLKEKIDEQILGLAEKLNLYEKKIKEIDQKLSAGLKDIADKTDKNNKIFTHEISVKLQELGEKIKNFDKSDREIQDKINKAIKDQQEADKKITEIKNKFSMPIIITGNSSDRIRASVEDLDGWRKKHLKEHKIEAQNIKRTFDGLGANIQNLYKEVDGFSDRVYEYSQKIIEQKNLTDAKLKEHENVMENIEGSFKEHIRGLEGALHIEKAERQAGDTALRRDAEVETQDNNGSAAFFPLTNLTETGKEFVGEGYNKVTNIENFIGLLKETEYKSPNIKWKSSEDLNKCITAFYYFDLKADQIKKEKSIENIVIEIVEDADTKKFSQTFGFSRIKKQNKIIFRISRTMLNNLKKYGPLGIKFLIFCIREDLWETYNDVSGDIFSQQRLDGEFASKIYAGSIFNKAELEGFGRILGDWLSDLELNPKTNLTKDQIKKLAVLQDFFNKLGEIAGKPKYGVGFGISLRKFETPIHDIIKQTKQGYAKKELFAEAKNILKLAYAA